MNPDELLPVTDVAVERLQEIGDRQLVVRVLAEPLQRRERLGVRRGAFEDLPVALDGDVDEAHLRLAERRETEHERELSFLGRGQRQLRLEVLRQIGPHLLA